MPSTNTGIIHSNAHINKAALLEKIGGEAMLHRAVDDFYSRLLNDKELKPFFEHANMTVLKWHQFNIMSIAFTQVPDNFDLKRLILTKHAGLFDTGLTAHHYDIVCQHFEASLKNLQIDPIAIEQAKSVVLPLREIFAQGETNSVERDDKRKRKQGIVALLATSIVAVAVYRWFKSRRHYG